MADETPDIVFMQRSSLSGGIGITSANVPSSEVQNWIDAGWFVVSGATTERIPNMNAKQVTITGDDAFTDPLWIGENNFFKVSIWGEGAATVTLQTSPDNRETWLDVAVYPASIVDMGMEPEGAFWRIGVKPGEHISGQLFARIGA